MQKIKVIHIIPTLLMGGAEKILMDIVCNYNSDKFEASIIVLFSENYCDNMFKDIIKNKNISIIYLGKKKGFDFSTIIKLMNIFKQAQPDLIHTHRYACIYNILPSLICRVPVCIHTVHTLAEKELPRYYQIIMSLAYKVLGFTPVAISANVKESISKLYKIEHSKIPQINNGINLEKYSHKKNISTVDSKQITIIHVGRFQKEKNHELLIDSFYSAWKQNNNIKLVLLGDGEQKSDMMEKVEKLGIKDFVNFTGVVSNVEDYLKKADIFALSSDYEGFGLVIAEAMASGLPIVTTDSGGISELVVNDYNGYVVKPGDKKQFSDKLFELINNKSIREKFSINSLERIKKYDIKNTTLSYEELYLKLLGKQDK